MAVFLWAYRALNGQKRRFPAEAVVQGQLAVYGKARAVCATHTVAAGKGGRSASGPLSVALSLIALPLIHFVALPLIRSIPDSLRIPVPLFLRRRCDWAY